MSGLAKQIALPHEYAPQRFPSFPALERTAVMGFSAPASLNLTGTVPTKMMVTRQAAWPVWAEYDAYGYGNLITYVTTAVSTVASEMSTELAITSALTGYENFDVAPSATCIGFSGANRVLPYPVVGIDNQSGNVPWTWMPARATCSIIVASNNASTAATWNASVTMERWTAPGEASEYQVVVIPAVSATNRGGIGTMTASNGGWFRPVSLSVQNTVAGSLVPSWLVGVCISCGVPTYTVSTTTCGTVTVPSVPLKLFLPLVAPTEFANSTLPWYSTRTTATAMLGTNVSQILHKAGTVLAGRVPPQVYSPFDVTQTYINGLHPAEKAFLPLETGVYTYCPPSTDLTDFWDYTLDSSITHTPCPVYRLDNTALVNVLFITAGSDDEQLAVTADWHIEFRTVSALFQVGLSTMTLESFHQAQLTLADAGFFFDNIDHKAILGKVLNAAARFGPALLALVNPGLGKAARMGVQYLSSKPGATPPASSAKGSGLVSKGISIKAKPKPKVKLTKKKKGGK